MERKPKYILIENLFENIDEENLNIIIEILNKLKENSIIIASENNHDNYKFYEDFNKVEI